MHDQPSFLPRPSSEGPCRIRMDECFATKIALVCVCRLRSDVPTRSSTPRICLSPRNGSMERGCSADGSQEASMETQNHVRAPSDAAMAERCANKRRDDAREDGHVHEGWGEKGTPPTLPLRRSSQRQEGNAPRGEEGRQDALPLPFEGVSSRGRRVRFRSRSFRSESISFERRYR